jgi:hypothetical protein
MAHLGLESCPTLPDHVAELRVQLDQQRLPASSRRGDRQRTGALLRLLDGRF